MNNGERPKTDKELQEYLAEMRRFMEKVTASREESLRFLVEAGIATPSGNLRSVYR